MKLAKLCLLSIVLCVLLCDRWCHAMTISVEAVEKYYCNGECDVLRTRCNCTSTCKADNNCCTDYVESCEGGVSWSDEECATEKELICPEGYNDPKPILLISLDGYRDIYLERNLTPTVAKLASCGVSVPYMMSQYPTKTFPNHYSMVTGLFPESHGIIANKMYNHDLEQEFRLGRAASFEPHWWHGEPIWVTVSNQNLKSAAYFWPGSDVNITRYPDYWFKYDGKIDLEERVYQLLEWVVLPKEERPSLIVTYTNAVDDPGHRYGPFSDETNEGLKIADNFVKMIMNGLRDRALDKCFTVMVMSDHGMASLDCENKVRYVGDHGVDMSEVYTDLGPYARIGKSTDKSLWEKFDPAETKKKLECKREETHWEAFLKNEYLPKRYHYANNPWIEDLHLVNDQEWWIAGDAQDGPGCSRGNHGFDNAYSDMRAIFFGHGPGLRRGYKRSTPIANIELYHLYADLLGIKPAPNNGTRGSLFDLMADSPNLDKEGLGIIAGICPFPNNVNNIGNDLGCEGCEGISDSEANERLNLDDAKIAEFTSKHLLYDHPRIFDEESDYCTLIQEDYVTKYDNKMKLPRLVSFVLKRGQQLGNSTRCVRRDPRISDNATTECTQYDLDDKVTWDFLYSPDLSSDQSRPDATLSSNMIPIYSTFAEIWRYMTKSMREWANSYNGISVDVGPIYDYNVDGHADSEDARQSNNPTHFFIVMTRCRIHLSSVTVEECSKDVSNIEVLSFIIPNYQEAPCHKDEESPDTWIPRALVRHVARVKDVELLTKISFFSKWVANQEASKENHLAAIGIKLHLPLESSDWLRDFVSGVNPTEPPEETTTSNDVRAYATTLLIVIATISSIKVTDAL